MTYREITCQQLVEMVTDYLEDALDAEQREHVERHLAFCHGCDAYLEQMRDTVRLTGRLRSREVSPKVLEALLTAFKTEHLP